jgi:LmbE family N-acetylglucosaminyl deacetylase
MTGEQEQRKVAMVIMAHPDDAEFSCAGTVAAWVRQGWDVYYVLCTDGGGGGADDATDLSPEARQHTIETRKQEQLTVGKILGLKDSFFLGYPDGQLQPSLDLRRDLVRLLRRYRPSRVICQSPDRTWTPAYSIGRHHPDHLAAGRAAIEAIYPASQNPWDFPDLMAEGLKPHKVSEVYFTGAPVVNYAVDITETIDIKMEALRAHVSQIADHFSELEQWMRSRLAEAGQKYGYGYAEEFHRSENQ